MRERDPAYPSEWSELRLTALAERASREPELSHGAPALTVLLGAVGKRSALEVSVAAGALPPSSELFPIAHLVALRGFARLGARAQAAEHAAALSASGPYARVAEQELAGPLGVAVTPAMLAAESALARGDAEAAYTGVRAALADERGPLGPLLWHEAFPFLLGVALAAGEDARAAELAGEFLTRFPHADVAPLVESQRVMAALSAGDAQHVERLARDESAHRYARRTARELKAQLELGEGRSPAPRVLRDSPLAPGVITAHEGQAAVVRLAGVPCVQEPTSLAGIRLALAARGILSARLRLDAQRLAGLLHDDARVLLAEERPVGTGFVEVVGLDLALGLVRVARFDRPGCALRTLADLERRTAHHGFSALVVWPGREPELSGLRDRTLDALDAAEPDVRDPDAGRARVTHLAEHALEACPDVPRAHQLLGEALLAQLRAGELEGSRADGPIEQWYARARLRFEDAEWAHQLYARALDGWNATAEAAIAWADARALDDADYQNALGLAQNRLRQGYTHSARQLAGEALARAPEVPACWTALAESALAVSELDLAERAAEAVLSVAERDGAALRVLGVTLEQRDQLEAAAAVHARAMEASERDCAAALRAALSALRLGQFEAARAHALAAMERDPADARGYHVASLAFAALGAHTDARSVLSFGLSRVGPAPQLVERYAGLLAGAGDEDDEAREAALGQALAVWSEDPSTLLMFADTLADAGRAEAAARFFDAAHEATGRGPNSLFREARAHVRAARLVEAEALLGPLSERVDNAYVHALAAGLARRLGRPPALALLQRASPDAQPALVWALSADAALREGDAALAAALIARCHGLSADALLDAARFLADHDLSDEAEHVLGLYAQHPRPGEDADALFRIRHRLCVARGAHGDAAALSQLAHSGRPQLPVIDGELDAAVAARAFEVLEALAEKRLAYVRRGADPAWGDGVRESLLAAAARATRGLAEGALAALASRYASHPSLASVLAHAAFSGLPTPRGDAP